MASAEGEAEAAAEDVSRSFIPAAPFSPAEGVITGWVGTGSRPADNLTLRAPRLLVRRNSPWLVAFSIANAAKRRDRRVRLPSQAEWDPSRQVARALAYGGVLLGEVGYRHKSFDLDRR